MMLIESGAPAWFQARVGKDLWRKFGAKRRKIFLSLPTLVLSLPTLDLLKWVGKEFLIHYVLAQSDKINQITQK